MRFLRGKIRFSFCAFVCTLVTFAWSQDAFCEVRPFRFIDGEVLANYVTRWILKNTDPAKRRQQESCSGTNWKLCQGEAFREQGHPERVALENWLLKQRENSVSPDQIYQRAFEITDGNISRGLTLVWDVLSEDWRNIYDRNKFSHIKKLIDITGERPLFHQNEIEGVNKRGEPISVTSIRGDNFSAWYHFAGTALRAYLTRNKIPISSIGKAYAKALIFLEENVIFDVFIDSEKRIIIDKQGAQFGDSLAANLIAFEKGGLPKFEASRKARNKRYLYSDPSRFPKGYSLLEGEKPTDYFNRKPRNLCLMAFRNFAAELMVRSIMDR